MSSDRETPPEPTFSQAFTAAAQKAGIAQVTPGEVPTPRALLAAIGGVRGLVESILPGFAFLVLFTLTGELLVSVLVPVGVAVLFVIARAATRTNVTTALAGALGVGLTALLAILTNKPEDNFLPGIIINAVSLTVLLVSLAVRWPFIGVIVALIAGDGSEWRNDRAKRRVLTVATWLWVGLFALRLAVQVPLYLTSQVDWLAGTKLIMGVPLYAGLLWVTWLLVRTVYTAPVVQRAEGDTKDAAPPRHPEVS
jgi:hypothetical protein